MYESEKERETMAKSDREKGFWGQAGIMGHRGKTLEFQQLAPGLQTITEIWGNKIKMLYISICLLTPGVSEEARGSLHRISSDKDLRCREKKANTDSMNVGDRGRVYLRCRSSEYFRQA